MSEATKISWCDSTWSPWRGSAKVSPGCANCYAETLSRRNPAVLGEWGKDGKRVINADWRKPLAWDRAAKRDGVRRRVFPSLCDVFEDRPDLDGPLARFFQLIHATPNLDWLVLTKRPELWLDRVWAATRIARHVYGSDWWIDHLDGWGNLNDPFPNVWLGVSVEDQARADERIPKLLEIPAAVRWLSVEPVIGPVDLCDLERPTEDEQGYDWLGAGAIRWVVIGGESGPSARPCDLAWIRSIVAQCRDAGVPVYVKQLGSNVMTRLDGESWPNHSSGLGPVQFEGDGFGNYHVKGLKHPKGGDPAEWPKDLRVREYPKQAKGGQP